MKKIFIFIITTLLLFTIGERVYAGYNSTIPQDVMTAANNGVEFVKTIMESDPNQWGFSDVDEIKRLTLGEGFQINYIDGDKLKENPGKSIFKLIDTDIIETWEFTLDLDGNPKVFLTVALEENEFRVVHFGGKAETFGLAKKEFKKQTSTKGIKANPTLIKAGETYYFVSKSDNEEWVLPVPSNDSSYSKADSNQLVSASVIIEELASVQNSNIAGERGSETISRTAPSAMNVGQSTLFIAIGVVLVVAIISASILIRRRSLSH